MFKQFVLSALLIVSTPSIAHSLPSDWRTPEADAEFTSRYTDAEIAYMDSDNSEETKRAVESKKAIAYMLKKNPEYMLNFAAKVCDQRIAGVSREGVAIDITRGLINSKSKLHPLAARYFGQQVTNLAIRYYCPSLS
jgi:hypothetical protein